MSAEHSLSSFIIDRVAFDHVLFENIMCISIETAIETNQKIWAALNYHLLITVILI